MSFATSSILLSIILTIGIVIYFFRKLSSFNKSTKIIETELAELMNLNFISTNVDYKNHQMLSHAIRGYKNTFNKISKTDIESRRFFSLDNISSKQFNLRQYAGFNNTLIGLGILFTFIGLTIGVGYFGYQLSTSNESNQTDAISNGINVLMGGMGTAFISSVMGMLLSIIFSHKFKAKINGIENTINDLTYDLDSNFLMTTRDYEKSNQEYIKNHINELGLTFNSPNQTKGRKF